MRKNIFKKEFCQRVKHINNQFQIKKQDFKFLKVINSMKLTVKSLLHQYVVTFLGSLGR